MTNTTHLTTTPEQLGLDLEVAHEREIDGVGMGVLSDGTPFLTVRGLARMCDVSHSLIVEMTADWLNTPLKPRERKIREIITAQGADDTRAFLAVKKNGLIYHTIPDAVCMAVLEYYAFEARKSNDRALNSYRILARKGFSKFIYAQVGYNPTGSTDTAWKQFHDRVSLNYDSVPEGHFSVFKEIADIFVTMLRGGANLGQTFVPDISIGLAWAKHWKTDNLDNVYGVRIKYDHNYPKYFPQSASNPQPAYCYPDDALGEFRKWVNRQYIPNNLPKYMDRKIQDGGIPAPDALAAMNALEGRQKTIK